ncbi:MAG: 23S rRNA (guanosine(2251)-2'-O)-methyltransferase RlmB [Candidatus Nucleicultricaceae bacterium]
MKHKKHTKPAQLSKDLGWIYGTHAVERALQNPKRQCLKLILGPSSPLEEHEIAEIKRTHPTLEIVKEDREFFNIQFGPQATHQGIALLVKNLPVLGIEEMITPDRAQVFVVLDQVTDPHNVGAILRSCAAFQVDALILPDMNACPTESPVLAKNASGALEVVPIVTVTNLARTLDYLKKNGFWCVGLDEMGQDLGSKTKLEGNLVLILGAEGKGMRRLTKENCDFLIRLPTTQDFATLNVSNAAAIVLYEMRRQNLLCSVN